MELEPDMSLRRGLLLARLLDHALNMRDSITCSSALESLSLREMWEGLFVTWDNDLLMMLGTGEHEPSANEKPLLATAWDPWGR